MKLRGRLQGGGEQKILMAHVPEIGEQRLPWSWEGRLSYLPCLSGRRSSEAADRGMQAFRTQRPATRPCWAQAFSERTPERGRWLVFGIVFGMLPRGGGIEGKARTLPRGRRRTKEKGRSTRGAPHSRSLRPSGHKLSDPAGRRRGCRGGGSPAFRGSSGVRWPPGYPWSGQ